MTLLIISSLMITPALAQTPVQKQDQQTKTTSPGSVTASDKTLSTVVATKKAKSTKKLIVGNKDTKSYHLFGMPGYNKVKKNHRIYFKSEKQAIANGYRKAGTDKDLTGSVSPPAGRKTIKNQTVLMAADSAESEKSSPEALQKNEKILEAKAQDRPKIVEEPQKLSGENIQKKNVNKETITEEPKDINQKLQDLQKQVDTLKEMGRTREKLTITTEEKADQEKAVLTAAGRDYTMMQKGKIELDYSLRYDYVSSSTIISATQVVARANHTISNNIDVQYGLRSNVTTDISVPYVYVYDKTGSTTAKDNSDLGDITLTLDYQPFKVSGDWPTTTIIMAVTLPTGRSPYEIDRDTDLPTGGGLYAVSLGVNVSKSIDPAMAFGSISATYPLVRSGLTQNISGAILDEVDPGMGFSAAIGFAYAMTYALSMNVQFQCGYHMSTDYHFSNTSTVSTSPAFTTASLIIGTGWRLSPLTTLSFSLGIGLTKDDADFYFLFRLPFTF